MRWLFLLADRRNQTLLAGLLLLLFILIISVASHCSPHLCFALRVLLISSTAPQNTALLCYCFVFFLTIGAEHTVFCSCIPTNKTHTPKQTIIKIFLQQLLLLSLLCSSAVSQPVIFHRIPRATSKPHQSPHQAHIKPTSKPSCFSLPPFLSPPRHFYNVHGSVAAASQPRHSSAARQAAPATHWRAPRRLS